MLIRRRRIRSFLSDIDTHVHKQPLSSPGCHPKYKWYQRLIANLLELSKNIWKWCAILWPSSTSRLSPCINKFSWLFGVRVLKLTPRTCEMFWNSTFLCEIIFLQNRMKWRTSSTVCPQEHSGDAILLILNKWQFKQDIPVLNLVWIMLPVFDPSLKYIGGFDLPNLLVIARLKELRGSDLSDWVRRFQCFPVEEKNEDW